MTLNIALDCRHYRGDRPCRYGQRCCCGHYNPMGFRILIIKRHDLGDVVRTTCVLPTLKREYPLSHITWLTQRAGVRILSEDPMIDRLVACNAENMLALTGQRFDLVLSLDKDAAATSLCSAIRCDDKRGVTMSEWGTPRPCNVECEAYFELGLDDHLRANVNEKSMPQLIHEALGFDYHGQRYRLYCGAGAMVRARAMFEPWRATSSGPLVGLNPGADSGFANTSPGVDRWIELTRRLVAQGYGVVLLGGPDDAKHNERILRETGGPVHDAGGDYTVEQFVALVDQCDVVVTGETLALHVAVGRGVAVVALFGPTCAQEVDLFGLGRKLVSPYDCAPCLQRSCQRRPSCIDAIGVDEIVAAVDATSESGTSVADNGHLSVGVDFST